MTPGKYFVYDSATVNGVAMTKAAGRLAEAYTCFTCPGTKLTDLGFSYTKRGEISDMYESTLHSGGYYHLTQSYWQHGSPNQLSGLSGLPTVTYGGTIGSTVGLDGEGRITQVTAASGQNPVTGVTYNNGSLPTQVNFGSGDNDIFAYDSNTLRMTQFKFNVGTQSKYLNGALTWNANSSLSQLAITDPYNSSDTQTCNYTHDDLARIATANCGTAANQSFSYDAFGNISKSGSPYSFQPTYTTNPPTNRFATIPGTTPSYDANGNVTGDGNHTYAWDSDGNSISIDTVGLTFDAFDHMVEQNRSGSYTQIVYGPGGGKLALMNGQTLTKAFVPLPGRATAIYTSSGLDHYRHSDWLGSTRLTSSPTRNYVSSVAYAPFGETYSSSGTTDPSFTGQNPDTVSSDYDFLFREYSTEGRWPSPDPAGLGAADPANPQSWNRYAYVINNPLASVDPLGLDSPSCDGYMGPVCAYGNAFASTIGLDLSDYGDMFMDFSFHDASYGGPPPDLQNLGWQMANQFLTDYTFSGSYSPLPTGLLNYNPNQGDIGVLGGQEMDLALFRHESIINTGFDPATGDPCVFSNGPGKGARVDPSITDPDACGKAGGVWVRPGQSYKVDPDGKVTPINRGCANVAGVLLWAGLSARVAGALAVAAPVITELGIGAAVGGMAVGAAAVLTPVGWGLAIAAAGVYMYCNWF